MYLLKKTIPNLSGYVQCIEYDCWSFVSRIKLNGKGSGDVTTVKVVFL